MLKFEIDHLKKRVTEVVQCTNGEVSTILNREKKGTGLTDQKKFELIKNGEATVKNLSDLYDLKTNYSEKLFKILLKCYEYPTTEKQKEKITFNKQIDNKIADIHLEIESEGKRLIDRAILKIIDIGQVPDELKTLNGMAQLARK
jgi:hypothetical protein